MSAPFETGINESITLLKQVLPLMSQQRVPTIPQNYTVWYDYVASCNDELCEEIQRHLRQGNEFSPDVCRSLYDRHCLAEMRNEVDGVQDAVREAVESMISGLGDLDEGVSRYSEVLANCGERLKAQPTKEDLEPLIVELTLETNLTSAKAREVEFKLQTMAAELVDLRSQVNVLAKDSRTDALTGVANRRVFDEALRGMIVEAQSAGQDLCLVLIDVDHFKQLNDTLGHLVGDLVLRSVALELQQCVKGRDMLMRYGGDEFALLLPATPLVGAERLAESIRAIIAAQSIRSDAGDEIDQVTISLGVACYIVGEDPKSFIGRADTSLYKSKKDGRNRVTCEARSPLASGLRLAP